MRRKHRPIVFGAVAILALGAAGFYFTRDEAGRAQINEEVTRASLMAQIEVERQAIRKYDGFLDAIASARNGVTKPEYEGYDGFSYAKESDYIAQREGHERRLADLQARLNSAYDR